MKTFRLRQILIVSIVLAGPVVITQSPRFSTDLFGQLRWRHVGPEGNRVSAVAGVPGDPLVYYAGSASGGIFKTVDAGANWEPIFDGQRVHSIGDIAVAPSDPSTVWAGTGEACIRSHISVGEGIFKSTDAGKSWSRMGLERTGRIGKIVVHPSKPDEVMACALGHAYGPQQERGVFRTTDGGATWERVLFVDENTGCSSLAMDPSNPRRLFAGMWQFDIKTWGRESGGPGSGLFVTNDGGTTWTRLQRRGLPSRDVGKTVVTIAPSNPNRVYALIETGDGVPWRGKETDRGQVWRSDDGGESWQVVSYDRNAMGRAHYYSHVFVAPDNEHETYFLTAGYSVSHDGGATLDAQGGQSSPGGDNHDMWIDPKDPKRMIIGNDGGPSISLNRGRSWVRYRLPNAQMYHVTADNQIPYYIYGNKQDGPSYRGPSNSRVGGSIPRAMWHTVAGGESGWATPDPVEPNLIWSSASGSGSVGGIVAIYEENRRQARTVEVWPDQSNGPPADLKYRFNWTMPLTISPHDRNTVYVGSQHVHRTTNRGQSWDVISPDLSTNDKSRQQSSGGLTGDNIGVEYAFTVMAIAESRVEKGLIWAGTNDGQVQLTRDAGKTWTNVSKNIPNLPPWGTVGNIEPSRFDAGTAYLTVDLHQVNNRDPFVYKTSDYGRSWRPITNGIPKSMLSYAHCIREDPVRRGLLYLGTENAIYASFDDGESWQPLQTNMPHAPVYWIMVQEHFNDLVLATYGRGFWIMDDITPLQQFYGAGHRGGCAPFHSSSGVPIPRDHRAGVARQRSDDRRQPAIRCLDHLLPEVGADGGRRHHDPESRGKRGAAPPGAEGRRAEPRLLGSAVRAHARGPAPDDAPLLARGGARPRRHAVRARRGTTVDPCAAGNIYRPNERRGQTVHAEARSPQGSKLGRERRRHSAADEGIDRARGRHRSGGRYDQSARAGAQPDRASLAHHL